MFRSARSSPPKLEKENDKVEQQTHIFRSAPARPPPKSKKPQKLGREKDKVEQQTHIFRSAPVKPGPPVKIPIESSNVREINITKDCFVNNKDFGSKYFRRIYKSKNAVSCMRECNNTKGTEIYTDSLQRTIFILHINQDLIISLM